MATFKFRLATLLKLREIKRDVSRGEYADALRALDVLRSQRASLDDELRSLRAARTSQRGVLNIDLLIQSSQHELLLRAQAGLLDKQSAEVQAEIERRRSKLMEADREVKVLEKLRDRQSQSFEQEQRRREAKEMDDISHLQAAHGSKDE